MQGAVTAGLTTFTIVCVAMMTSFQMSAGEGAEPDVWPAVSAMMDHVAGLGYERAIDGTRVLSKILEGEIDVSSTRVDDPPSSWDLVRTCTYCDIYLEQGQSLPSSVLDSLGDTFDSRIYPNSTTWFHPTDPPERIKIRIYDFGDGNGGVGGFFIRFPTYKDDLYLDIMDSDIFHEILAHEFQHLLHYDLDPNESVWLDEGMADLSIRVSLGPNTPALQGHIYQYEQLPENDLLSWDEGTAGENIADYGAAYSYMAYLADHYGGSTVTSAIVENGDNSISSVDDVLSDLGHSVTGWEVHTAQKVANLVDDPVYGGGIYDQGLLDISISTMAGTSSTFPYSDTEPDTERYAGYYYRFDQGGPNHVVTITSDVYVHTTLVGLFSNSIVFSQNITSTQGSPAIFRLNNMGLDYDILYVIPSTDTNMGTFTIDVIVEDVEPPVTEVIVEPAVPDGLKGYYVDPPSVSLIGSEGATTYYRWDGGDHDIYTSPLEPPEGIHTLYFYSRNDFGVSEEEREALFKLDTLAPVTGYSVDPEEPDGLYGIYVSEPVVTLLVEENATAYYSAEGPEEVYVGPFTVTEGETDLSFYSVDEAGNVEIPAELSFKVDLTDPRTYLTSNPPEPDGNSDIFITEPTITLVGEGDSIQFYSLNGGEWFEYKGPFELADGTWTIRYYSMSSSGRDGPTEEEYFKVDGAPPSLTVTTNPPLNGGWISQETYLRAVTDDEDANIRVKLGGDGPYIYSSPILLTDGSYTIEVWVEDPAGNRVEWEPIDVRIDMTAPDARITFNREPDNDIWFYDEAPLITFENALEVLSDEEYRYALNDGDFMVFEGGSLDLQPGRTTVHYYGIDTAGNRGRTKSKEVGVDMALPLARLYVNRTIIGGYGPVTFYMDQSSDDVGLASYRVHFGDGTDSGWIASPWTTHNYTTLGDYYAYLEVKDVAGRTSQRSPDVLIEVLTPEEARRRLAGDDEDDGLLLPIILVVVILLAVLGIGALIFFKLRRDRYEEVEWVSEEEEKLNVNQ